MTSTSTLRRIYTGEGGINFVGRRKTWYSITGIVLLVCLAAIIIKGFSFGIDFEGGTKMNMPATAGIEKTAVAKTFEDATGESAQKVQIVGAGESEILEINSKRLTEDQISKARVALFDKFQPKNADGETTPDVIGDSTVSESWGSTITKRMLIALGAFLILIFAYITLRFERDMAIAAMCGIIVDGIVVSGIYALIGFEVSPATVIGLLTVLAFSLYDTVVVFDKVKENTAGFEGSTRRTYAEQANLAVNQTVMRSIATTVISALPIASLMVVAVWLMGVGTLKDLAMVQFIGVIEGTFSSVFLATPILVSLKNRQKKVRSHNHAVEAARAGRSLEEQDALEREHEHDPYDAEGKERVMRTVGDVSDATPMGVSWRPGQGN